MNLQELELKLREKLSNIDDKIPLLMDLAKILMGDDFSHGWPHVLRVLSIALKLAKEYENIDLRALSIAAILHDIGRSMESKTREHHAIISAKYAEQILRCLGYDEKFFSKVKEIILYHSYSLVKKRKITTNLVEAKILSDADKLDALGAIGIARVIMYSALVGRTIEDTIKHFEEKIVNLKNLVETPKAKKIAEEKTRIIEYYLNMLERELTELEIT